MGKGNMDQIKISLKGAFLSVIFMAVFFSQTEILGPSVSFEMAIPLSALSFFVVGVYEMRLVRATDSAYPDTLGLIVNITTPFFTILGIMIVIVAIDIIRNGFRGFGGILDTLGFVTVLTPFWFIGIVVMSAILFLGGVGYDYMTKNQKR